MIKTYRTWLVIGLLLCLTGCHFILRGQTSKLSGAYSPMQLITTQTPPRLTSIVKRRLLEDDIQLSTPAAYRLTLHQETIQKNILSISTGSSSRQYQLLYRVFFSFEKTKGPLLFDHQSILVTRFLTINNDKILGSHDEEAHIIDDMRFEAALQIVARINALPRSTLQDAKPKGNL